ncbi:MAG: bifunctional D-glycero-beta-D-manno-heptose-7-phosphate kinase/D-glycero-beta-D-manno-heptose 1-phosphate adenylyltransferase HldE [Parvibaculaceae bacterium]|nr:bifunctional D-glycero-beta-D-manno-heptose-7-phosphate kinase/D-glycero-beta-D-manno-heptose 1-phosphate adenylyltransferase HldE [Parvibaculaceae bacterium]
MIETLDAIRGARVLCVGDLMLDSFVYGRVERVSPESPVPVMLGDEESRMLGGVGNVVRNVSSLGGHAVLVSVIGEDEGALHVHDLVKQTPNVTACLLGDPSRPTTTKTRYVAGGQQLLRVDYEIARPVSTAIEDQLIQAVRDRLPDVGALVLSDYAKGVLSQRVIKECIQLARAQGCPVVVDPKSRDFSRYAGATLIKPNTKEMELAAAQSCQSDEELVQAAQQLIQDGELEALLVTRSEKGMSLVLRDGTAQHQRTAAREVYDVSGAGDTVNAALGLALAAGVELPEAMALANEAAGIAVSKTGTATVSNEELSRALLVKHSQGTHAGAVEWDDARGVVADWQSRGLSVGFTNGCFDILHPGHIHLLRSVRAQCDRLIVGINSDASVSRLKGPSRPINEGAFRAEMLAALVDVDLVVIFEEDTPLEVIQTLLPDVLAKGGDYTVDTVVGAQEVQARGGKVILIDLVEGHSTTKRLEVMRKGEVQ